MNTDKKLNFEKKLEEHPQTAAEVALRSTDPGSFSGHIHDWMLYLQTISTKAAFLKSIEEPPEYLSMKINDKGECDAYLAAYIEWLCLTHDLDPPEWTQEPLRTALDPWYDPDSTLTETRLAFDTHPSFKNRNLFTIPENVLVFRRGRPRKTSKDLQQNNAERQKRFRDKRREEWLAYKKGEVKETRQGNDFMQFF